MTIQRVSPAAAPTVVIGLDANGDDIMGTWADFRRVVHEERNCICFELDLDCAYAQSVALAEQADAQQQAKAAEHDCVVGHVCGPTDCFDLDDLPF